MHHRDKRVADAIKEMVANIVVNELSDPKIGFVTVTRCSITRDLKLATVYFSIMGKEAAQKESLAHIEHARGYIRHRLGQELKLRYLPELRFALDEVLAQEMRISELISDLHHDAADTTAGASPEEPKPE
jgi:ribosome-binding factor A